MGTSFVKSYYTHLQSIQQYGEQKEITRKPTLRSSALFPVIHNPNYTTSIHFLGYWLLKRKIPEISLTTTLRDNSGKLVNRKIELIDFVNARTIELKSLLNEINLSNEEFIGSIETEFNSTRDMVFPFPALVLEYHNNEFNTCVHTLGRTYNDFEDLTENDQMKVPETGFDIYSNTDLDSFFAFVNGPMLNKNGHVEYILTNSKSEKYRGSFDLGMIRPYETKFIFLKDHVRDLSKILGDTFGSISLTHNFEGFFPRFLVGNVQKSFPSISFTHSYYDCTDCIGKSDFWNRVNEKYYDSSAYVPIFTSGNFYTDLIIYPIFSPSNYTIKIDLHDQFGNKIYENNNYLTVKGSDGKLQRIRFKDIISNSKLNNQDNYSAHVISTFEDKKIPARVKFGLDVGISGFKSKLPCNICFNAQLSNFNLENKPGSFHWSPIFKDDDCVITIGNFSPIINYAKDANIELQFFRKKDSFSISRNICLKPNCEKRIRLDDKQLKEFFDDDGWLTIKADNPWILGYYFNFHPSGSVAGDHFF